MHRHFVYIIKRDSVSEFYAELRLDDTDGKLIATIDTEARDRMIELGYMQDGRDLTGLHHTMRADGYLDGQDSIELVG